LPDEVERLEGYVPVFVVDVGASNLHLERVLERVVHSECRGVDITSTVVVVLDLLDARVIAASHRDCGRGATRVIVNDVVVAHNSTEPLIFGFIVGVVRERCLEAALRPVSRGIRGLT